MQRMKKMAALLCAVAMLITCAITGIALPVAAERANTFKLSAETLYLGDGTSSWSLTAAVKALNLDGTDYTAETLTWTSSNSAITTAAIDTNTVRVRVKKDLANGTKTTITFTSSSGESHSCDVIVAFDGEMISGGDFESATLCSSGYQWGALINGGASRVVDPDDPTKTNHVLKLPASLSGQCYYRGLPIVAGGKYKVAFDIKGIDGSTGSVFFVYTGKKVSVSNIKNMTSSSGWYGFKTTATEWTHVEFDLMAGADYSTSDANYIFNFKNAKTAPLYLDNFTMYEYGTAESISLRRRLLPA
ncbi:MAG: hypothetical protein IIX68_04530 [Clostridia bacterium]|nr:hypothetical protein [Clostridia bacterium]